MGATTGHRGRWITPRPFVAVAVAMVAAMAVGTLGCDADNEATTTTEAPSATAADPGSPAADAPSQVTIRIVDKTLMESDVVVAAGGTVRWENSDTVAHEIISPDSDVIRSPVLGQGESYTARFTAPGEYPYYCNIHNFMKGTVVVR